MPIKRCDSGGDDSKKCQIAIEGEMTIYTAQELKEELIQYLDKPWDLHIDLSQVTELDSSGAQLLLLAQRETVQKEQQFETTLPTGSAADALAILNIADRLNPQPSVA